LDKKEIEMLDEKYVQMMNIINSIILRRLQYATIPFEARNNLVREDKGVTPQKTKFRKSIRTTNIAPDAPCPCGSQKKYCECHGGNIRSNNIHFYSR
jgi:uncharacterized protein YchJ